MSTVIDFGLSEEERLLGESARRFADEQLRPAERRHEAERGYPEAVRARYRALGFATMSLPESAGGVGLSLAVAARAWERLAAADPAAPIGLGVAGIAALARSRRGAILARDRQPGAVVVVEPTGDEARGDEARGRPPSGDEARGRPPSGDEARGRQPSGDEARGRQPIGDEARGRQPSSDEARGRQPPIVTERRRAGAAARSVANRLEGAGLGSAANRVEVTGMRGAANSFEVAWLPCARPAWLAIVSPAGVELATDIVVRTTDRPALGLRAAGACAVRVPSPAREPIGDAAESARWLVELRVLAAACMLGAARDAADYARSYAKQRVAFGKPIAHHQGLAFALVEAATDLDAAGLLLAAAAAGSRPDQVAAAHAFVARTALHVVDRSLQALGGHGYLYDHPVEKRMRDVRALASLYGGVTAAECDAADGVLGLPNALVLP